MSTAILYQRPDGSPVTIHSYSGGLTFSQCAARYNYERRLGWKPRRKTAALEFGKAVEASLQFFHENGCKPGSGEVEFKRRWLGYKEDTTLSYTAREHDWQSLYHAGADLLALYAILLPSLPIVQPVWQASYRREVFPGTELAGIEHTAFADMVSRPHWNHPMLPRVPMPPGAAHRALIVDIKTAATDLDIAPEMLALDPQLRQYAWTSGVQDVGFLWLVKARPGGWEKGSRLSLLKDVDDWAAGSTAVVLYVDKPEEGPISLGCLRAHQMPEYDKAADGKRGKALEECKRAFVAEHGKVVPAESATKARIQFVAARIDAEDLIETGNLVGRQIVEIVNANRTGQWPKNPSVRFPDTKCSWCAHRGLCLKNDRLRDELLVQIAPASAEPDWLDELVESTD